MKQNTQCDGIGKKLINKTNKVKELSDQFLGLVFYGPVDLNSKLFMYFKRLQIMRIPSYIYFLAKVNTFEHLN